MPALTQDDRGKYAAHERDDRGEGALRRSPLLSSSILHFTFYILHLYARRRALSLYPCPMIVFTTASATRSPAAEGTKETLPMRRSPSIPKGVSGFSSE